MSTGDGVVIAASYTGGNGNFVKIKHNSVYTTQYLHMSKRNAKVGNFVKQGDIIGYVGSTGLATGPHVCYRFWKNGKQVDHLRQDFPSAEPIQDNYKTEFYKKMELLKKELDSINYQEKQLS
jgi:murein DD-endopeptidase MepM/ murein hydrolase activator NlpD